MGGIARIAVLGAGSWGTALAALLARNGLDVRLCGRRPDALGLHNGVYENPKYLPGIDLPAGLAYTTDAAAALAGVDALLLVVPSHAFAHVLKELRPLLPNTLTALAWATKGFEPGSGDFLHEVADRIVGVNLPKAVVTGPSFAREVALGLPSAVTVHSDDDACAQRVAKALHGASFRAYSGNDMRGAELGGAMKNVLAVATGICDGMQLGLNARAGLITRGLNEMLRLNLCLGGRAETMIGLAGLGDLVLTCTGDLSRNRRLGLALGRGVSLADAVAEIGQVVESVQTADEVMRLATRHGLDLPISSRVHAVLHGQATPADGLKALLARDQKPEYPPGLGLG
ncbi:MAG: NAD(P)-dependent glycerol-3-phosphate dehydrogenase [Xanthomonadales bacterium]|nr:Glycerol-3-phosphate dehydrogenase [NAD(P)+] [Xanthomonadales bacterium]MCC6594633.1 NAD(P)-dependent glycerol-3-phosphate dehydrogenase [Xanthomonadales bacterium]MCE7932525.1 NAD(P)-dependent glycerol-3-phosphate dehydrogenase [Xanthomonadales bacterium PRO6]